ncbi:MAG: hypothetical protein A2W23_01915 [Planctomycetes bacterium RBG_16_43_13]|nr:MAG: hypothetical protein A2W23_01915 [Planctomycetes bacterium RBG_16_43_13]
MKQIMLTTMILLSFFMPIAITPSYSSEVFYVDMPSLSKHAFDIVEGEVIAVECKWYEPHNSIYTYTTIRLEKALKNKVKTEEIILKDIGGKIGDIITSGPVLVSYTVGEKVLVFLQRDGDYFTTYCRGQGKYRIEMMNGAKVLKKDINLDELRLPKGIHMENIKTQLNYSDLLEEIHNNMNQ